MSFHKLHSGCEWNKPPHHRPHPDFYPWQHVMYEIEQTFLTVQEMFDYLQLWFYTVIPQLVKN